ncbi:MAG: LysR family transcriptional regulator, partial [Rhodobacteraceae bacterium]|nr:LysR family transcriptional regulator [Paracoccaceae bacterium]
MPRIDLHSKLVQSFLAVLRMQSYTKAAQALNLSQPAISQHIGRLEEVLDFRIIERNRGVVLPTVEAQTLLPDLKRFDRSVELIFEKARAIAQGGEKTIRIAAPSSLVNFLLAPAVAGMHEENTEVFPVFRLVADHGVYDMVRAGEVDFALTSMSGSDSALSCTFLLNDRPCLVCPDAHPLNEKGPIDLEAISRYGLIRPPKDTASNSAIEMFERVLGQGFTYAAEAEDLLTLDIMARAGLGLVILPALSAKLISHSGLNLRPIGTKIGWRDCQLIQQQHSPASVLAKQVMDSVKIRAKKLSETHPELV